MCALFLLCVYDNVADCSYLAVSNPLVKQRFTSGSRPTLTICIIAIAVNALPFILEHEIVLCWDPVKRQKSQLLNRKGFATDAWYLIGARIGLRIRISLQFQLSTSCLTCFSDARYRS